MTHESSCLILSIFFWVLLISLIIFWLFRKIVKEFIFYSPKQISPNGKTRSTLSKDADIHYCGWFKESSNYYLKEYNKELEIIRNVLFTLQTTFLAGVLAFYSFGSLSEKISPKDVSLISGTVFMGIMFYFAYLVLAFTFSKVRLDKHRAKHSRYINNNLSINERDENGLEFCFFGRSFLIEQDRLLTVFYLLSAAFTVFPVAYLFYLLGNLWINISVLILFSIVSIIFFSTFFRKEHD